MKLLLEAGARPNSKLEGALPLHMAVCVGTFPEFADFAVHAIRLLVDKGAIALDRDDHGRTGLHWAACAGLVDVAKELLDAAAAYALQQKQEQQESELVSEEGHEPIKLPTLVEFQDKEGNTAIHLAARYRQFKFLKTVLDIMEARPEERNLISTIITQRNKSGCNALHMAALGGDLESVQLLVEAGPPNIAATKSRQGKTAGDIALRRGHVSVSEYLQKLVQSESTGDAQKPIAQSLSSPKTLVMVPPECLEHHTCPWPILRGKVEAPPENVDRLTVLVEPGVGSLRTKEFKGKIRWDERSRRAPLSDILRVHDWAYVRKIQKLCDTISDEPSEIAHLDGDTAVSRRSFRAALAAAGAACHAVDEILQGKVKNAFCAVRPPGHHAGPAGIVTSAKDPNGSHGFCLFNNAAIAAAYGMTVYRHAGIKKVAILDFDVHHGNGTEACVTNTVPSVAKFSFSTPYGEGVQQFPIYKPWYDVDDNENIFFASVQGYGPKMPGMVSSYVYPGSGATCDTWDVVPGLHVRHDVEEVPMDSQEEQLINGPGESVFHQTGVEVLQNAPGVERNIASPSGGLNVSASSVNEHIDKTLIEEDPDKEFLYSGGEMPRTEGPRIIDVGIPGPGSRVALWRRSWRDKILPALVRFDPDLIVISAGFDAHKKDEINFAYIGVQEKDFEWLTDQIVQVANRCCSGRIVSLLEGGYRIQGGVVSAFARSVAAHVRALSESNEQHWDPHEAHWEREHEKKMRAEAEARRIAAEEAARAAQAAAIEAATAAAEAQEHERQVADDVDTVENGEKLEELVKKETGNVPLPGQHDGQLVHPQTDADDGASSERRKRRRGTVDYVALNKKLEEESRSRKAAE